MIYFYIKYLKLKYYKAIKYININYYFLLKFLTAFFILHIIKNYFKILKISKLNSKFKSDCNVIDNIKKCCLIFIKCYDFS